MADLKKKVPDADYSSADFSSADFSTTEGQETVRISENVVKILGKIRSATTETIGITELVTRLSTKVRMPPTADIVGISETPTKFMTKVRAPTTDIIGISETISRVLGTTKVSDSDIIGISEAVSKTMGIVRIPNPDTVGISENVVAILQQPGVLINKEVTDTVGISESVTAILQAAPISSIAIPPLRKRRIAQRQRQRLIEPFKEITREELEKEKEEEQEQELRTTVTSKLRFVYDIQSSTVYQEVKKIKDALAGMTLLPKDRKVDLTPQYSRQEIQYKHEPQAYDRPEEEPLQELVAPTTPIITKQTGTERDIEKYKFSSSLKFSYAIKDGILYNKLLKYARLLDTIDIVDKLEEQEESEREGEEREEIMIQV